MVMTSKALLFEFGKIGLNDLPLGIFYIFPSITRASSNAIRAPVSYALSLPFNLTACPYFCSFVINASPCLTTSVYCLFLSSGRFVSMIPLTRSIVHGMRSAAMNLARSLQMPRTLVIALELALIQVEGLPIQKVNRHAKFIRHTL